LTPVGVGCDVMLAVAKSKCQRGGREAVGELAVRNAASMPEATTYKGARHLLCTLAPEVAKRATSETSHTAWES